MCNLLDLALAFVFQILLLNCFPCIDQVPWIIVTSHYPIFLSTANADNAASALGWSSDAGEVCSDGLCDGTEFMSCREAGEEEGCETVGDLLRERADTMGPLFQKYGVDIYDAGHSHLCE